MGWQQQQQCSTGEYFLATASKATAITREEAKPRGDNVTARRRHINIHDHHRHQLEEPSSCNS